MNLDNQFEEENPGWTVAKEIIPELAIWAGTSYATAGLGSAFAASRLATKVPSILKAYNTFSKMPLASRVIKGAVIDPLTAGPLAELYSHSKKPWEEEYEPFKNLGSNIALGTAFETAIPYAGRVLKRLGDKSIPKFGEQLWDELGTLSREIPIVPQKVADMRAFQGRRTLAEIFQPAVERLDQKDTLGVALQFRNVGKGESFAQHQARIMAEDVSGMNIEERNAFYTLMKKGVVDTDKAKYKKNALAALQALPQESQEKISKAVTASREYLITGQRGEKGLDILRENTYRKELANLFKKDVTARELGKDPNYMKEIRSVIDPETRWDPAKAQDTLIRLIENPSISKEAQDYARSLYMLQEEVVSKIPSAAAKAEKATLFNWMSGEVYDVAKNPTGIVSNAPVAGWVKSQHPEFKGSYMPKDVDLAIKDMEYIPNLANSWYNKFFLTPWKVGKVVFNLPTHFRNVFGNIIQNDWGGLPMHRMDLYWDALGHLKKNSAVAREFTNQTGLATTMIGNEFTYFPRVLPQGGTPFDIATTYLGNIAGGAATPMAKLYQGEEVWAKLAKYLHNLEKGMDKVEAAKDAVKWTFNYGEVTPIVKFVRTSVMPFGTWTAKVIPLMLETAVKHPYRLAKWATLPSALTYASLKNQDINDDDWKTIQEHLPRYMKNSGIPMVGVLPVKDGKGRLQLMNYTWMIPGIGDVAEYGRNDFWGGIGLQNPLISLAADYGRNKSFSGAPIWNEWDEPKAKVLKAMTHGWVQLMPNIMGTTLKDAAATFNNEPQAMTPGQLLSGQFGIKPIPLDPAEQARKFVKNRQWTLSEIKAERRRKMKRATTESQREAVMEEYRRAVRKVRNNE